MSESVKKLNLGIALIKVFACLGVISLHFGGKAYGRRLAVPAFIFIAIYLSAKTILSGDGERLRKRLWRLFVPYATWGIIGYVYRVFVCGLSNPMDLVEQLLTGYPTCGHMYYVNLLFWFTILLFLMAQLFRRWFAALCPLLIILSFVMQYSGWNYALFGGIEAGARYTLGRFFEFLPLAVCGLMLAKVDFRQVISPKCKCQVALALFGISSVLMAVGFPGYPPGFAYCGFAPFLMCLSLCVLLVTWGALFPSEQSKVSQVLCFISTLTPGIYYCHMIVGWTMQRMLGIEKSHLLALVVALSSAVVVASVLRLRKFAWIMK